jgi:hypothetical protein
LHRRLAFGEITFGAKELERRRVLDVVYAGQLGEMPVLAGNRAGLEVEEGRRESRVGCGEGATVVGSATAEEGAVEDKVRCHGECYEMNIREIEN